MQLYDNIKKLRLSLGMSQEDLALLTGYTSRSSIAKIENGNVDLSQSKIEAFAKALHTTPQELMGWEDTTEVKLPELEPVTEINIFLELCCGNGMFVDDNVVSSISVPTRLLPKGKKEFFAQYAKGDSMIGKDIFPGDLLVFSKEQCESGDIGCFCIDENVATCKILKIVDRNIILLPANDKYDPIPVDTDKFRCVGKLVLKVNKV